VRQLNYKMKLNLFKNMTFAIASESFQEVHSGSQADFQIEQVRKFVQEYGGKLVHETDKAIYVVAEDGYLQNIWSQGFLDELNRKIVHLRWVKECVKVKAVLDHSTSMHLNPLPHAVPLPTLTPLMSQHDQKRVLGQNYDEYVT